MNIRAMLEEMHQLMIEEVNEYIKGKKNWRGENHVRTLIKIAIEGEEHPVTGYSIRNQIIGIQAGYISFNDYKKELKRKKKFWEKVRAGNIIDHRKGIHHSIRAEILEEYIE